MMTSPARFLFEQDFNAPVVIEDVPEPPQIPMIEVADHEKRLEAAMEKARQEGYQVGLEAGRNEAAVKAAETQAAQTKRTADEARRLATAAQSALAAFDADRVHVEKCALELAYHAAKKLADTALKAQPEGEIIALLEKCLAPLRQAPHLVLRLEPTICETLTPQLQAIAQQKGFEGRLMILPEPDVKPGDCRVEWADGGIARDRREMEAEIEAHISAYAAAHLGLEVDLKPHPLQLDEPTPTDAAPDTPALAQDEDAVPSDPSSASDEALFKGDDVMDPSHDEAE